MSKLAPFTLLALLALVPMAAAQANPGELPASDAEAPAWETAIEGVGDGLAEGGAKAAEAVGAAASGAADAAAAAGRLAIDAFVAVGHGIAFVAGLVGDAFAAIGAALLGLAKLVGRGLLALTLAVVDAAAWIGAALLAGGQATWVVARDHPRETAIVAGSAASAGGLAWIAKRFGWLALLPLYTRLAPSQILDNEQRARVFEHVKANPGAHPSAMAERLGLGWGTVVYHLSRLEQAKLLTVRDGAHRKCYFVVGGEFDADERQAVAAMATDKAKVIVHAVRAAPGITQKDLAERVGISQALASWHVKRLVQSGVLLTSREGRSNTLRVAEHVPVMAPASPPVAALPA